MDTYKITSLTFQNSDTFILQVKPATGGNIREFKPGQYVEIVLPNTPTQQPRYFSIASSPHEKHYLEVCIRVYGKWTKKLSQYSVGDTLLLSEPKGTFYWKPENKNIVILAGGVGISPIMSMLRYAYHEKISLQGTLLYGNRTPDTIMYRNEIERIVESMPMLKVVHILSDIPDNHVWGGYRGFITKQIIEAELHLPSFPTFFIVGPPIFITKMREILRELQVNSTNIKIEQM